MVNLKLKGTDHAELLQIIFQKPFSDCISVSIKYPGLDFVKLSKFHLYNYNVVVQLFAVYVSPHSCRGMTIHGVQRAMWRAGL